MRQFGGRVEFPCDRETAFDYLADPRHRPEWQSSLKRVSEVDGQPRVGQTWVDETKVGIKPRLRTTEFDRPARWSESGTWRFVRAELTLDLPRRRPAAPWTTCSASMRWARSAPSSPGFRCPPSGPIYAGRPASCQRDPPLTGH